MKRLRKITRMEKFEMMIGKAILTLIGGIIATAIFFGIMYLVGWLVTLMEKHFIITIILLIIDVLLIAREFKEV